MERCTWATDTTEEMQAYHDDEWGRPVHEEQQLFELLTLESMQAGLSWAIILNKRETLRANLMMRLIIGKLRDMMRKKF